MKDRELRELLFLFRLLKDQPRKLAALLAGFGSAGAVLELASPESLAVHGALRRRAGSADRRHDRLLQHAVDKDMKWLDRPDHHLFVLGTPGYPALLTRIPDPPVLLFGRGNPDAASAMKIAMVGSRSPTRNGLKHAREFAQQFAMSGLAVTSGLASGIDGASHQGALLAKGITVAVLGTGCDRIYPQKHQGLADEICEQGLILSEFPLGTPALAWHFPRRNRIVTGLSLGVLVVEARRRSGSMISARLAAEQGREVFVLPGSVRSIQSSGCHELIRDGATLVENVEQVLQDLGNLAACHVSMTPETGSPGLSRRHQAVVNCLGAEPVLLDELSEVLAMDIPELVTVLVELEMEGVVMKTGGGYCLY